MSHGSISSARGPCQTCAWVIDAKHCAHPTAHGPAMHIGRGCCYWAAERPERPPVRVIVCGGRDYFDRAAVWHWLDHLVLKRDIIELIHGAAPGADSLAGEWAAERRVACTPCPADWKAHGKRAGPLRNAHMLTLRPDGVVAFPGGRGTEDMVMQAIAAGLPVWRPAG